MRDLIPSLTPQEELDVESSLKRLYTLQDKPLKKETLATFVFELSRCARPMNAILAGIDSLKKETTSRITLNDILNAIDKFHEKKETASQKCDQCMSGFIVMKDEEGRNFSLACNCPAGDPKANQGNVRWNGGTIQTSKGRQLTRA